MAMVLFSFHLKDVGVSGLSQTSLPEDSDSFDRLMSHMSAKEGFCISTCNRNEYLFFWDDNAVVTENHLQSLTHQLVGFFNPQTDVTLKLVVGRLNVIEHLLSVSLSRDSMIFGESQILGQFKRAYQKSIDESWVGAELSPLLNRVIREAKLIRTEIGLTQIHTSVSTVAGAKVLQTLGRSGGRVLLIGSGETNQLFASYLKKRGYKNFVWSSRGHQRAVQAASELGGEVLNWEQVERGMLPDCDVICTATHSKEILVTEVGMLNANPKLLCDLSVPANICETASKKIGVEYFGIDKMNLELQKSKELSEELLAKIDTKIKSSSVLIETELEEREFKRVAYLSKIRMGEEAYV